MLNMITLSHLPVLTGDWSEYDIESYWKVVVVFQEWYGHRGSLEPVSVNIIDLTWRNAVAEEKSKNDLFAVLL